jgi:DNA-binding Xre family transcriptional regulator
MAPPMRRLISADELNALMVERRVSNQQLADVVGVTKGNIGHLRTGLVQSTTALRATAIEEALHAPAPLFGPPMTSNTRRPVGQQR